MGSHTAAKRNRAKRIQDYSYSSNKNQHLDGFKMERKFFFGSEEKATVSMIRIRLSSLRLSSTFSRSLLTIHQSQLYFKTLRISEQGLKG